jgi:hypothetical protein
MAEHDRRVFAQMARAEARAAGAEAAAEACGPWCQVKRQAGRVRLVPRLG